jgi:hypothetical protein
LNASMGSITGTGLLSEGDGSAVISDGVTVGQWVCAGTHTIRSNGGDTGTSKVNALTLGTGTDGSYTAKLDVNDNRLIVEADPAVAGDKEAKAAMLQGALWTGAHGTPYIVYGITSGTVRADESATGSHMWTLGMYDNGDLGLTTFGGQSVDANSLLVEMALLGDSNRDGVVDGADLAVWTAHAGEASVFTEDGDFNHDGAVDGLDLDIWTAAEGNVAPAGTSAILGRDLGVVTAVPEAGTLGVLAVGVLGLLGRRRRDKRTRGRGDMVTRSQGDEGARQG